MILAKFSQEKLQLGRKSMHTKNIFIPDTKEKPFLGISPILNSPTNVPVGQGFLGSNLPNPSTQNSTPLITFHKKGFQEMKVRKVKGLCFNCDEKYSPTHNCLNKRLLYSNGMTMIQKFITMNFSLIPNNQMKYKILVKTLVLIFP